MKVHVDGEMYDSECQPISVVLSQKDKENISNMAPDATEYCSYPDDMNAKDIERWMREE
ncbi:unnamed protein product [marine sediment metagenome]|uniref:Uncharacterized protein n=1 Tax=marine sediment metagenome TaxID=412755 RepID=X1CHY0_9ZZZZ